MSKVAVFGAGSWGTAFSIVLADAGHQVTLWARRDDLCATINEKRENSDYLPGIELPDSVHATHDQGEAAWEAEVVVLAVPSQTLAGQPRGLGQGPPSGRRPALAHEGRRARDAAPDERGHRRRDRRGA